VVVVAVVAIVEVVSAGHSQQHERNEPSASRHSCGRRVELAMATTIALSISATVIIGLGAAACGVIYCSVVDSAVGSALPGEVHRTGE
jgi:hypothetical protein